MLTFLLQIARDDANLSKGYGFVSFNDFGASDSAIANMHGQYLSNKEISVQYAYKKDGKGERHGDAAERMLAAQAREHNVQPAIQPLPPQLFQQAAPPMAPGAPAAMLGGPNGYAPPPQGMPPQRPMNVAPLPPPPQGLPARPPPSQAGYGGPPPGFAAPPPQQGYPPPGPPMGFGGYPPQVPQGFAPPGFMAPPPGMPLPPGYSNYGR